MLLDRVVSAGGAKLLPGLAIACLVLLLLLGISAYAHVLQFRSRTAVVTELTQTKATSAADLRACGATNTNVVATVHALGKELHACRGSEQELGDSLRLATLQRDRAKRAAAGEKRKRIEAIDDIAKTHATCSRPVCRALSDELLSSPTGDQPQ